MNSPDPLVEAFVRESGGVKLRCGASGAALTTMHVGGAVSYLVEPQSADEARAAVATLIRMRQPRRVLGAGSNVLIPDVGVPGWVIRLGGGAREITAQQDGTFWLGAASSLMSVSRQLAEDGWSGLEFAGGIPASIGGAVRMNAGAHGGQMADVLEAIEGVDGEGQSQTVSARTLHFSYRRMSLPEDFLVTRVCVRLLPGHASQIAACRGAFLAERKARQPLSQPSCGSVFRNPAPDLPAGKLIEQAGLKGTWLGGAQISEMHGNWIVNPERHATCADVRGLIELCRARVYEKFKIDLEPEVVDWGKGDI